MDEGRLWTRERRAKVMRRFNVLKPKFGFAGTTRGSPSLVNGVRLRTSSLRGSRVRIPPPAPLRGHRWSQWPSSEHNCFLGQKTVRVNLLKSGGLWSGLLRCRSRSGCRRGLGCWGWRLWRRLARKSRQGRAAGFSQLIPSGVPEEINFEFYEAE
jgi:hypothetical protein